jgi:hypothetical protein
MRVWFRLPVGRVRKLLNSTQPGNAVFVQPDPKKQSAVMVVSCTWVVFFPGLVKGGGCILYPFLKKGIQDTTTKTLKKLEVVPC